MNRIPVLSMAIAIAGGCGDQQRDRAIQDPSLPVGSISGRVTDLRTGAAAAGVQVSVIAVGAADTDEEGLPTLISASTDAEGHYALADLAAGTGYRVRFIFDGFVPRFADTFIPNAAGKFPQGNAAAELNMQMAAADATISGRIFARDGQPAAAAVAGIDLRSTGFDLVLEAVAGADGSYSLAGLPGAPAGLAVTVAVQPFDEDGDGAADYGARNVATATFPETNTRLDIDLRVVADLLLLLFSNVQDGVIGTTDAVTLVFNRPLDLASTPVALNDDTVGAGVAVVSALDAAGTTLSVEPAGGTDLAVGHDYTLTVNAQATNGARLDVILPFLAVSDPLNLPSVTGLVVQPMNVDFDTIFFTLDWDAVAGAASYDIFARDNFANPTYLRIDTSGSAPAPSETVPLPGEFDYYTDDGMQTPFAFGVDVDFAVVPVDASGRAGDPIAANEVQVSDNVDPIVTDTDQFSSLDNTFGLATVVVDIGVDFSEYIDPASAGSVAIALPITCAYTFSLDPGLLYGTFTITVDPGQDCSGCVDIDDAMDTSGNTLDTYTACLF